MSNTYYSAFTVAKNYCDANKDYVKIIISDNVEIMKEEIYGNMFNA